MLEILLAFFGNMFAKIFSEVAKDVLKTPAKEIEITEVRGDVDIKPTPVDELITDYRL
jgi:hypothetical protein